MIANGQGGREQMLLDFIASWTAEHGYAPTLREMCDACGFRSTNAVRYWLDRLERRGAINRPRHIPRAISVVRVAHAS